MTRNASRTALLPLLIACTVLSGCGLFSQRKTEYLSDKASVNANTLEVPPDLVAPSRDDRYTVPSRTEKGSATLSTYNSAAQQPAPTAAPGAATSGAVAPSAIGKMRIERAGTQRWLVVPGTPESLWPVLRSFWSDMGFTLKQDTPSIGVMETDWAENRSKMPDFIRGLGVLVQGLVSTPERDKFRTRVEQSSVPGMVEVYISHRGLEEVYIEEGRRQTQWQPRPTNPELEAEMLSRLMVRLGADETQAQRAVTPVAQQERARLGNGSDGVLQLTVDESLDRAWRQVGLSLDRVGLVVEDRDRAKGTYLVRYIVQEDLGNKKDDSSWLGKLAFWRNDDKKLSGTDQYRILVQGDGANRTSVRVLNKEGAAAPSESARQILTLLYNELK